VKPVHLDRRPVPPARCTQSGATFIELMLAVLIISTTLVASTTSMQSSASIYHYFADGKHEALMLAQEIHEAAKLMPWEHVAGADPVFGEDVWCIWDLDGKTYNPPRSADYDVVVSNIGWSQVVEVKVVDMLHPDVEVDPLTFGGQTLVDLKVTIKQGASVVDTVDWWMSKPSGQ
jgi:Tfp pilus assembly protein PilV